MPRPKDPVADLPDVTEKAKVPGAGGVTRRSFLTNVATAGIAATAAPLLRATPRTIESPQAPAVSNPADIVPVELKINEQLHQLQIETRVTLLDADVRVSLLADGTARAVCATQDIGTGTYTVFAAVVSDRTGIPLDKIRVQLGDTALPPGPTSGGSSATATVLPAIVKATDQAVSEVFKVAALTAGSPFEKTDPKSLKLTGGRVHRQDQSPESGTPFPDILKLRRLSGLDGQARTEAPPEAKEYSMHSFGAHFCEVAWDPGIARLRVSRWLSVIDGGQMINLKTSRNQILGAAVMGIGMALFEETIYDPWNGKPVNNNYADYIVSVNADAPEMDCIFLDYPDTKLNEYGARGIGEIGLTGCASAIANATYHATGVRVRELPIRIENLL